MPIHFLLVFIKIMCMQQTFVFQKRGTLLVLYVILLILSAIIILITKIAILIIFLFKENIKYNVNKCNLFHVVT